MAVKGYQRDGFEFIEQAKANGAVAVMGERERCPGVANYVQAPDIRQALADVSARFYDFPGKRLKACGVTGTNGKTTTCYLLKHIFEARLKKTGMVTSNVYDTGKQVFKADRTTPESLDLQRLLYLMKSNYCVNAIIEVSSHALVLHRVDHIDFRVAVYTNITRDHLDFHKTMEDYLAAKALLAQRLDGPLSYAVINLDVDEFRPLFGELRSSFMSYSLQNPKADVYCDAYELKPEGTTFDLVTPMGRRTVSFRLPGRFNLTNALAAATGGLASGVDLDNVVKGLEAASPVPGRLNPIICGQPFGVFVDFAHTPDAIERLCETARELTTGRLLLLFGCGGDRDRGKRPLMGAAATKSADVVVVTSDNTRSEDPIAIIEDIKPGLQGANFEIVPDRVAAIDRIIRLAQPGDSVLLAGKGAETYMEVHGVKHPFDEYAEAGKVLATLGYTRTEDTDKQ